VTLGERGVLGGMKKEGRVSHKERRKGLTSRGNEHPKDHRNPNSPRAYDRKQAEEMKRWGGIEKGKTAADGLQMDLRIDPHCVWGVHSVIHQRNIWEKKVP